MKPPHPIFPFNHVMSKEYLKFNQSEYWHPLSLRPYFCYYYYWFYSTFKQSQAKMPHIFLTYKTKETKKAIRKWTCSNRMDQNISLEMMMCKEKQNMMVFNNRLWTLVAMSESHRFEKFRTKMCTQQNSVVWAKEGNLPVITVTPTFLCFFWIHKSSNTWHELLFYNLLPFFKILFRLIWEVNSLW